jgi:predicted TPR repeat methyltransferase
MPQGPALDFYLFEKAKALQQGGLFSQAEDCYRKLLERDPKSVKALNNLGTLFEAQKRMVEAEWAYRRALAINPNSALVHYNLGHAMHVDGRLDQAESSYRRTIALDPGSFSAYFNLGRLLEAMNRFEDAEPCYRRAIEIVPESTAAHSCLGETLYRLGRFPEALAAFESAVASDPTAASEQFNVGKTLDGLGRLEEAATAYHRAVELGPLSAIAHESRVRALERLGRRDEAVRALAEWQFRAPGNAIAVHLLAALSGLEVPERASDACIRQVFDPFAADYDAALERLSYRGPVLIGMALAKDGREAKSELKVLDAGCGTGLCADMLKPWASHLVGVDLSARMLDRARARGGYDELVEDELVAYLRKHPDSFDIIASADTLIYFGTLEPLFAAASQAMRPQGRLIFTVEHLTDGDDSPWRLTTTGRYSHSEPYLRHALGEAGLPARLILRAVLRQEGGQPVSGLIVLAERKGDTP